MLSHSIYHVLMHAVSMNPDKVAVIKGNDSLTYQALYEWAYQVYKLMQPLVKIGERIICALGNSLETWVVFWAAQRLGAVISIVPANAQTSLNALIEHEQPALSVLPDHYAFEGRPSLSLKAIKATRGLYTEEKAAYQAPLKESLAALIYTSGSTGQPKGVMMTQKSMLFTIQALQAYLNYQHTDRVLCALPLHFDYACYQMLLSCFVQATIVLCDDSSWMPSVLKLIRKHAVSIVPVVPAFMAILNRTAQHFNMHFDSVRLVTNTGAMFTEKHQAQFQDCFPKATLLLMYGLTECKRCTYLPFNRLHDKSHTVGLPIPGTICRVFNPLGQDQPPMKVGEVVIEGEHVMQGYFGRPEETKKVLQFLPKNNQRRLYTGDYGYLDHDGFLVLLGRKDELVKYKGVKFYPSVLEKTLACHELISHAVVWIDQAQSVDECLMIAVAMEAQSGQKKSETRSVCRDFISKACKDYQPFKCFYFQSFPKTRTFKIDKKAVREQCMEWQ